MHEPTYVSGVNKQSIYLPNDITNGNITQWYFYPTRSLITPTWEYQDFYIGDQQLAVFVKSGTILPILDFEIDRMSILSAIDDPIRLEVFPDSTGQGTGKLYLDDGLTNDYQSGAYAEYEFTYSDSILSVKTVSADAGAMWAQTSNKMISEVVIQNMPGQPWAVQNKWIDATAYPVQEEQWAFMNYIPSTQELRVYGVMWPVNSGQDAGTALELLQIWWTDPNDTAE